MNELGRIIGWTFDVLAQAWGAVFIITGLLLLIAPGPWLLFGLAFIGIGRGLWKAGAR